MLGKFAHEVEEQLTMEDIDNWIAYSNLRDKENVQIQKKAKTKKR